MNGVGSATAKGLSLGQAIAKARRNAHMTQQQLCNKANLSYSTLAKIERDAIKTPSVFTVVTIAEATGTTVEALTGIKTTNGQNEPTKAYKTSKTGIKFVYFDVNGTLVHYFHRAIVRLAADTGVAADTVEAIFWHYNDKICRGEMSMAEFDSVFAKQAGTKKISWAKYYLDNIDPVAEMDELVKWVAKHYRIGLMTNMMPGLLKTMIETSKLPKVDYDAIIDSSEVKAIKPEMAIYNKAAHLADVKSNEILLIDDSRTNLMAAEHLGWHMLWFDDSSPQEGVTHIRHILEF